MIFTTMMIIWSQVDSDDYMIMIKMIIRITTLIILTMMTIIMTMMILMTMLIIMRTMTIITTKQWIIMRMITMITFLMQEKAEGGAGVHCNPTNHSPCRSLCSPDEAKDELQYFIHISYLKKYYGPIVNMHLSP